MSAANNTAPNAESTTLEWVRYYVGQGFCVVPLYAALPPFPGKNCSCRKQDCKKPGKHPRIKEWQKLTPADMTEEYIQEHFGKSRDVNVGIVTTNHGTIDVDPKHDGHITLVELQAKLGELPPTQRTRTGSGGEHYIFSGEIPTGGGHLGYGIDTRGPGGYIVAPPSIHESGNRYSWQDGYAPWEIELASVPDAYRAAVIEGKKKEAQKSASSPHTKIISGGRNKFLFDQASSLRGRGYSYNIIKDAINELNVIRCHPPLEAPEVKSTIDNVYSRYKPNDEKSEPKVVAGEVIEPGSEDEWKLRLQYATVGGKQQLKNTFDNVADYLMFHPGWKGLIALNKFTSHIIITQELPSAIDYPPSTPGHFTDTDFANIKRWLTGETGVSFSKEHIIEAVELVAKHNAFDPLQDHLNDLEWDRVPRIQEFLTTYLGAQSNNVNRHIGRLWLMSAVARAMKPGCKCDTLLILEGTQGKRKSTAIEVLFSPWYSDTKINLDSKDAMDNIRGKWAIELGELASLKKEGDNDAKNFFSSREDYFRPAYARKPIHSPRRCVFVGSTNEHEYLTDDTGGRRYWPVETGKIDIKALMRDRDQLWAEAVVCYRAEDKWWVDEEDPIYAEITALQATRRIDDAWYPEISRVLNDLKGAPTTVAEVLSWIGISMKDMGPEANTRARKCMRLYGYKTGTVRVPGFAEPQRRWVLARS